VDTKYVSTCRRDEAQDPPLSVFDVISRRDVDKVAQLDSTIASGNCDHQLDPQNCRDELTLVHCDFTLLNVVLTQADQDGVLSTFAADCMLSNC
jgi:hypothetical protein